MTGEMCRVIRLLRDSGPMTRPEMGVMLDVSRDTLWHWVALLAAWGLIRPNGHKKGVVLYELAPPGQPMGTPYVRKGTYSKRLDKTTSA